MNRNRVSALLVLALLVFAQSNALFLGSANTQPGTINTFSNGSAAVDISLTAGNLDTNYSLEVPRNVTFQSGQFMINAKDEVASPGQVSLDIGLDGINEWAFDGLGFGDLGHQNKFMNNASSNMILSNGSAQSSPFYLPHNSVIDSATMDMSFTSQVPAGLIAIDDITAYETGDVDNDTLDEVVVKANVLSQGATFATPSIASLNWSPSTAISQSSWVPTCGNGGDLFVVDINDDDFDDVVSVAPNDDRVCFHKTSNITGMLGNATPVALTANLISAQVGDVDGDGFADILSIHQGGVVSLRAYDDRRGEFKDNNTLVINANGTMSPTQLTSLYADYFNGTQGDFSALVVDFSGYTNHVKWINNGLTTDVNTFDGLESEITGADFDQDGDIDLFSSTQQGYVLAENNGSTWSITSFESPLVFINVTIADHDSDGSLSLLAPQLASGDGNAQTIEGNISVFDISTTNLTSTQSILEPWSCPTNSKFVDMDADGLLEHIVTAGEGTNLGLFIGSWNSIGMDIDQNGQDDLFAAGYAGDGLNGTSPLQFADTFGLLPTLLSPMTSSQAFTTHDYDIKMNMFTFSFSSTGTGYFNLSNMDIGYDIDFIVENNPAAVGNLTNIINQQQTGGTGLILIDLPFLSTKTGILSISSLNADYIPGAPNLILPPQPILSVDELTSDRVVFSWQNESDFVDLNVFEIFKVPQGDAFDLNSPAFETMINFTLDADVNPGDSYDYAVRSLHPYGVTSQLSTRLSVTIPFPSPPLPVQGLTAADTAEDNGSSLTVTWNASAELVSEYRIFVESEEILSLESYTSVSTITPFIGSLSTNVTTEGSGIALVDRTDYWLAVAAYDSYGNTSSNFALFGPVQSQNNSLRSTDIIFEMATSGFSNAHSFEISALDSLYLNLTLSSAGEGIPMQNLDLHFIGPDNFEHTVSGVTDESGKWNAVQVEDLTELANSFSDFIGEVSLVAEYAGTSGDAGIQPADMATSTLNGLGLLRATVSAPTEPIQLDTFSQYAVTALITPELPAQSARLANIIYDWHLTDAGGNITDSGIAEIRGGEITLAGSANSDDLLTLTPSQNQDWFSPTPSATLSFTFLAGQVGDGENETGNDSENVTDLPSFPDVTLAGSMSCEAVTYAWEQNSSDATLRCTITNPNPFEVQVGFSWAVIPATPPPLSFEPDLLPSSGPILTINANETLEITFTPVRNGPSDGLLPGLQGVGYQLVLTCMDDGTGRCSAMSSPSATTEGELQWTLAPQLEVDEPVDVEPDETKGGSSALVGGIIALLVLGGLGAAFVLLRPRTDDDDDWFDEVDDDDEDESAPVSKPSRSLDEMKSEDTGEKVDFTPQERRPSLFDEFDGRENIEQFQDEFENEIETLDEETEHVAEETAEDDGITVDEEGTEWWEDEEGVWWYREQGWEDWAVWED